jgi:acyl-CoA synthetase (NDP forming)/RimJ/RimL family protein N-acetyltransferase
MGSPSNAYPWEREADVVLRDGATMRVRPVRVDDGPAIHEFLAGLSRESIGYRFFGAVNLDWATSWSLDVDYSSRFALVGEGGSPYRIVAHAAYVRIDATRAEVAFLVADEWQGRGISTILLAHLAEVAEPLGISTFVADVLPHNHRMIDVFRQSGFPVELHSTPDALEIELPTSLSPAAIAQFEERDRIAAVAAVRSCLEPSSVAVIGASRRRGTIGGEILYNLLSAEFHGSVYAVNDKADVVQSVPAHRSVREIPDPVELAVIAVPARYVVAAARDCAAAGVRALLVISSGFAEIGGEGRRRQRELVEVCRRAGVRIVGPNCLGSLNTSPEVRLNATFATPAALQGGLGFTSQSGGLGIVIIDALSRLGIGLSSFVSVGNKCDLSGNDVLQYWEQDDRTELVLLYLESFGNPRKFARVARRVAAAKPVLAVKSGRAAAGARATSSHTGAMLSASEVTVDVLFEQAGVIRTDTLSELFNVVDFLSAQPIPRGDRVVVVTNASGPAFLCTDAFQTSGADIAQLPADIQARLRGFLPEGTALANPVDMVATASAADYRHTLETLIDADACDVIIAIFVTALETTAEEVASAVREVAERHPAVAMAAVFMVSGGIPVELTSPRVRVPGYEFPEAAAQAVALAVRHARWRARDPGSVPWIEGLRSVEAAAMISRELARGEGWLSPTCVAQLFECFGLPLISTTVAPDAERAAEIADELGAPVALKAVARGLVHKTDAGGVCLGVAGAEAVRAAAAKIERAVGQAGYELEGLVVQPMASEGVEMLVGIVQDHSFGPVVACGAGGTTAELIKDVSVRITPLTDVGAREMVRSLKTFPLLDGYRGAPCCDVAAIEDVLLRLSAMVEQHAEIVALDCSPLIAGPDGAVIVDARVRVETAAPPRPIASIAA